MTDVIVIFHCGLLFTLLPHNLPPKMKIEKKKYEKTAPEDIIILRKCTKNHDHVLYCSWDMVCDECSYYFWFWAIFCPFTLLKAQKIKISKKREKWLEISLRYIISLWFDDVGFLRYGAQQTDGRTDGQTEKVTHRSGYPT